MKNLELRTLTHDELPWELLLEADPSRAHIESYIDTSDVLGLLSSKDVLAVVVLSRLSSEAAETMNIAVTPRHRGKHLGKRILQAALDRARALGVKRVLVGTGNSSLDQLAFYQEMGSRMDAIDRDYFVRHYAEPIVENGIPCRDMVRLSKAVQEKE